jgi:subtilase family serine protease
MTLRSLTSTPLSGAVCLAFALFACVPSFAQTTAVAVAARITAPIDDSSRVALAGSQPPRAKSAVDAGPVSPAQKLEGMTLVFGLTAAQQAALDELVAAQQNPASALYHHWLTPAQFGAEFGMAGADLAAVETWLEQQGFTVGSVSNSRTRLTFSGTAAQVAAAFGVSLHNYTTPASGTHAATTHFAPSGDLTIPSALASSVVAVENLSDYRPHAHVKLHPVTVTPKFTSAQTGANYLTPLDVATIYDIAPATSAGFTGTGQTIVVIGQSAIETSDLTNFQTALGIPSKLPNLILVPGTGTSEVNPGGSSDSDEVESDLDLEYSDAIAQGATIDFVYTGSDTNDGAFDALEYAVDNEATYPANIISSSYGECEPGLGSANYTTLNAVLEQAASQGQTVISAAGDAGSTDCDGEYASGNTTANEQLAVDFPGSSQYVTALGGTEFPLADIAPGSSYFDTEGSSDIISSAKSYIPEQVWNDDAGDLTLDPSENPISAGGGGVSIYTARPSWQTGVTGIPTSGNRLVPDLALYASPSEPDVSANTFYGGFLFCSSDSAALGVTGSCSHGFRDTNDEYLTVAGGTSFDAPIFSGMLAIINQAKGYTAGKGQGAVNSTLYALAANATTYASAFHDITSGGNECAAGATYCGTGAQTTDYAAGTGYDEASGLGSVDLYNLLTAWPASSSGSGTTTLASSTTTVTAATATVAAGTNDTITITVASNSASATATPTGTLTIMVNGTTETSTLALSGGTAQYTFSAATAGSYVIEAVYSGDGNYDGSSGTTTVTVGSTAAAASFSLTATNVTVAAGATGTSTVTITPTGGFTGTVDWTSVALNGASSELADACFSISNATVSSSAAVATTLTIYTSSGSCSGATTLAVPGKVRAFARSATTKTAANRPPGTPFTPGRMALMLSGLVGVWVFGRKSKAVRLLTCLVVLGTLAGAVSGCGSGGSTGSGGGTNAAAGTYSLTITGTDSANSAVTASAGFTLTIE